MISSSQPSLDTYRNNIVAKPVLKWAGGKTQLLPKLKSLLPSSYNKYIEPFIGGGALFFDLKPEQAIIADSNSDLINLYKCLASDVNAVIRELKKFRNTEENYYKVRAYQTTNLDPYQAAARIIYLNKTCFNGLYRVNRKGEFNVPYGKNPSATICNEDNLRAASLALQGIKILNSDYKTILKEHSKPGDLIFLDPPYLPVSEYADFKRYTKEQFYEEDHHELAQEVHRLNELGCHVIITNSNHPLVHELFGAYEIEVCNTQRNINSKGGSRKGQDVIINVKPKKTFFIQALPSSVNEQTKKFPPTRYMGSKEKLLPFIQDAAQQFDYESVIDLFSGTGVVGYMFKSLGKQVTTNDYMHMNATLSRAMIANNSVTLTSEETQLLFKPNSGSDNFVQTTFKDLYFSDSENQLIDTVRANIKLLPNQTKRDIAMSALIRACLKKRPRGIFTYTGMKYNDGRADLKLSFEEQMVNAVELINHSVFNNSKVNKARQGDAMNMRTKADLVYIDPPYFSPLSDNEYVRRYHFVEGLARNWENVDMQWHTKTKKFKSYPTPFSSRSGAQDAFDKLFKRLKDSILFVSYSSNSLPTKDELIALMSVYKQHVEVIDIDHKYSFGNQKTSNKNTIKEYLFVGY